MSEQPITGYVVVDEGGQTGHNLFGPYALPWQAEQIRQQMAEERMRLDPVTVGMIQVMPVRAAPVATGASFRTPARRETVDGQPPTSCTRCGMIANVDPVLHEQRYGHTPEWEAAQ